jgi:hypothetical protein
MEPPAKRKPIPLPDPITPNLCPCGGQAWLKKRAKLSGDIYAVECEKCDSEGPQSPWGPQAVEEWNEKVAKRLSSRGES